MTNGTDCSDLTECLRCNTNGCIKCINFLMEDSKTCVQTCPGRYSTQWSTNPELMGRICVPINLNSSTHTVMAGVVCGILLCILVLLLAIIIYRRKQKVQRISLRDHLIDDGYNTHEFLRQLEELRPYAACFLSMLNDTRKEIRKSYIAGDKAASEKFYPFICDLAKVLILLNRPVDPSEDYPNDWNVLLQWAQKTLSKYDPLYQFKSEEYNSRLVSRKNSTFKSLFYSTPVSQIRKSIASTSSPSTTTNSHLKDKYRNSSEFLPRDIFESKSDLHSKGSLISMQDLINECAVESNRDGNQSNFLRTSFGSIKDYLSNGSLLVIEDELIEFRLGLRPQDEIITEL